MATARAITDKTLEEMERHLTGIYTRAQKEVGEAWFNYLDNVEDELSRLQEEYEAIKKTGDKAATKKAGRELAAKKREKTLYNQHYQRLTEQMAAQLSHVNETAAAYINGKLPKIYAVNYNEVAEGVAAKIKGISFDLVDASTVKRLSKKVENLLPLKYVDNMADIRWNVSKINSEVLQGIVQGESIPHIADRMENVLGMNRTSAIRNARTAVTGAENGGRLDMMREAREKGVLMHKIWLATHDNRTRHEHLELDGVELDIDEPFENSLGEIMKPGDPYADAANVYNCFLGETNIASDCEIIRSYKHEYSGELVTIKTAGGVNFTCTPNHPILTVDGWIAAKSLQEGNNILVTFRSNNVFGGVNPNINHCFPRIDAIHEFFDVSGGDRTVGVSVNFHGDIPTADVEIIAKKRFLWDSRDSSFFNSVNKFLLKHTDKSFLSKGALVEHFGRICRPAFSFICSFGKAFPFIWGSLRHSKVHSIRPVALLYSGRMKPLNNNISRNAELICECLDGFSGIIFADNIVSIDFSSGCSHVYNLQTEKGYYFVNNIIPQNERKSNGIFAIAHNCRCTLKYKVVGFANPKTGKTNYIED